MSGGGSVGFCMECRTMDACEKAGRCKSVVSAKPFKTEAADLLAKIEELNPSDFLMLSPEDHILIRKVLRSLANPSHVATSVDVPMIEAACEVLLDRQGVDINGNAMEEALKAALSKSMPSTQRTSGDFQKALEGVLNAHSKENGSNTPDFILAVFLDACLRAFDASSIAREDWYGYRQRPGQASTSATAFKTPKGD